MKKLFTYYTIVFSFILLFAYLSIGCCNPSAPPKENEVSGCDTTYITIFVRDTTEIAALQAKIEILENTISTENWLNGYKLSRIQYYIDITKRNANNKQFFYGWILRVMDGSD